MYTIMITMCSRVQDLGCGSGEKCAYLKWLFLSQMASVPQRIKKNIFTGKQLPCVTEIDYFTVVSWGTSWPFNGSKAGGYLALMQTSLHLSCKCTQLISEQLDLHNKNIVSKQVISSLAAFKRPGHCANVLFSNKFLSSRIQAQDHALLAKA